jgi:hypothetical protein
LGHGKEDVTTMAETPTRKPKAAPSKVVWNDEIEHLYSSWHRRVAAAEYGHRLMSDRMRNRHLALGIPVVVLTTIVGTSVFASLQDTSVPTAVAIVVGSLSLLAAVLSSLQTFMRYALRSDGHRIAAIRYETLRRDMAEVLAMPRAARADPARELDGVRGRLDRYAKESPLIGQRLWEELTVKFHLSKVPPDPRWAVRRVKVPEAEPAAIVEPGRTEP